MNTHEVEKVCCICGQLFIGWGNNPWPVRNGGECCDECNREQVIPARLKSLRNRKKEG